MPESELNLAWFLAWLVLQRNRLNFGIIYIGIMVYWHAPRGLKVEYIIVLGKFIEALGIQFIRTGGRMAFGRVIQIVSSIGSFITDYEIMFNIL